MLDYLLHLYGDIALYLYALLLQYLPPELALPIAGAWPGLTCLCLLAGLNLFFTWQDRRDIQRSLARLRQERGR
ncbi:hypothetical protein D3C84_1177910 [compost metagenome]